MYVIRLESKFYLGGTKYDEISSFNIQGEFICHEPITQFEELLVDNFLYSLEITVICKMFVSSANKKN